MRIILFLAPFICAVSSFPQAIASIDGANRLGEDAMRKTLETQTCVMPTFNGLQHFADALPISAQATRGPQMSHLEAPKSAVPGSNSGEGANDSPPIERVPPPLKPTHFPRATYYRTKLDSS